MGVFCLLVHASMLVSALTCTSGVTKHRSCNNNICDVMVKMEQDDYKRDEFEINLSIFAIDNNLQSGHKALKKELEIMGHDLNIEMEMPLQTYLIRYQKIIQEEAYDKMKQLLEDDAVAIKQKLDDQNKKIAMKFDELNYTFNKKLEDQDKYFKLITEKLDDIQINLSNETKILQTNISNKIDEEIENVTEKVDESKENSTSNPFDCLDIQEAGEHNNGKYLIYPQGHEINVYCDMTTDGGGWTVFLNRQKQEPQLDFKRKWQDYKNGFGSPSGELWLGNEALHLMTAAKSYFFRADAEGNGSPTKVWVEYSTFRVASEYQKYQLTLKGYNTNSTIRHTDGFGYNDGQYFSTIDADNDDYSDRNCAKHTKNGDGGGFWYSTDCSYNYPTLTYGEIYFHRWSTSDQNYRYASSLKLMLRPIK